MTIVTFHLVCYELNVPQCLAPLKNSSCAVLGCEHIWPAPPPPPKKKVMLSTKYSYLPFFLYFKKKLTDHLYSGICYLNWGKGWMACILLQFLQPSLSEFSWSSCRLCNDPATIVAQINFTLPTMYLLIYTCTVAILNSFVLNSYCGMLQEKRGTTVFLFIVKYI